MSIGRLLRRLLRTIVLLAAVLLALAALAVAALYLTNPTPRLAGWTQQARLPEARGESAAVVVGIQLYVLGGLAGLPPRAADDVTVWDQFSDTWFAAPPLPEPRHHLAAAVIDGTVLVSGGADSATDWIARDNLWQLPVGSTSWQALPSMPEPRLGHRMLALGGRLYVVGGTGGSAATLVFDPAAGNWSQAAPIPRPRDHLGAVAVGDEIWAIGGRDAQGTMARVEIYDPQADTWRDGPSLPAATSAAAEAASDSLVVVSGGEDPALVGGGVVDRHWWLDTTALEDGWRQLPPPPLPVHGAQGAFIGNRFYLAGGAARAGALSPLAWSDLLQVIVFGE